MTTPQPAKPTGRSVTTARRLGRYAGRRQLDMSSMPYDPDGGPADKAHASAFVRGYLAVRPPAPGQVDYSGDDDAGSSPVAP